MRKSAGGGREKRALARLDTSLVEYPRRLPSRAPRGNEGRSSASKPRLDQPRSEQNLAGAQVRFLARTRSPGASAGNTLGRGTHEGSSHAQAKFSARIAVSSSEEAARRSKAGVAHFVPRAPRGPEKLRNRARPTAANVAGKNSQAQVAVSIKETARRAKGGVAHFAPRAPLGPGKIPSNRRAPAEQTGELEKVMQTLAAYKAALISAGLPLPDLP